MINWNVEFVCCQATIHLGGILVAASGYEKKELSECAAVSRCHCPPAPGSHVKRIEKVKSRVPHIPGGKSQPLARRSYCSMYSPFPTSSNDVSVGAHRKHDGIILACWGI